MRVVDTSAWIETLIGSPSGAVVTTLLPARADWLVPTIVQLELAKWLNREAPSAADSVIAFSELCVIVALDTRIALAAAECATRHRLATADAIVYATATTRGADLVTCDSHFEGLPGVTLVRKPQT